MNYSRKKITLLMSALIVGQAMTMQNMQGMYGHDVYIDQEATVNFWTSALSGLYNNITNKVSTWNQDKKPIAAAIKGAIQFASWSKPVTAPILLSYGTYTYLPSYVSYPFLVWGWNRHIKSIMQAREANAEEVNVENHAPNIASQIFSQFKEGAQEAGITAQTIQNSAAAIRTLIDPVEAIKQGYETSKAGVKTVKDDLFNTIRDEVRNTKDAIQNGMVDNLRAGLNIPANQPVNFDTITDKLTDKFKAEIEHNYRAALNIPANQPVNFDTITDKLTDKFKAEMEHNYRAALNIPANQPVNFDTIIDKLTNKFEGEIARANNALKAEMEHNYRVAFNIPADQPVNAETIAKKVVEEPVRKIFNINPNEAVTADAVMSNLAKNTIYRFGIPTAVLVAATPIAITAGYFGCKYAYHRLTTEPEPPIFIESSQKGLWQNVKNFVLRNTDEIPELAYSAELERTFDLITRSSINAFHEIQEGNKKIFYEPILMYGPPGTGKTAKAKQMIKQIYQATNGKMQWRITNGSMLLNAGQKGINKMFEWLNKQTAACLFIDEADTLFPDRDEIEKYPERLEIVNHLLSLIGERSNKFMIIMTTNRLGAFDEAMARRIDNLIHIPLPNEQGRKRVLMLYRDNMLLNQKTGAHAIALDASTRQHLTDAKITEIARITDELSNGDLQGIINKIKTYASITENGRVTPEIINLAVKEYVDKHNAFKDAHNKKKA